MDEKGETYIEMRERYTNREFEKYVEVAAQALDRAILARRSIYDFSMERNFDVDIASLEPQNIRDAMAQPFSRLSYCSLVSQPNLKLTRGKKTKTAVKSA